MKKLFEYGIGIVLIIGSLAFLSYTWIFIDKLTFIPNISFCDSYSIMLCDIPILSRIVKVLDLHFIIVMFVWVFVAFLIFYLSEKFKKKK